MSKALRYPIDKRLDGMNYLPYTISYCIRKRIQVDNFYELPKEKRPPSRMIWEGSADEIENWLDKVFDNKQPVVDGMIIDLSEVE